jgi:hypothetical protein
VTRALTQEEKTFYANLEDQEWRLNNLYYIKSKQGKKIKFKMNWAQKAIWKDLWYFSIILKARQLGVTTFFCILYLDLVLFSEHKTAGIIAHKDKDARKIFKEKVKFAWDNLPEGLKDMLGPPNSDSAGELAFPNGSSIFVSTSTRGGTIQYLHISEFGYICAHYPGKAEEIVTGSINSVESGQLVTIESTAEGRSGYFFDFCDRAMKQALAGIKLSPLDFKFFFFSWWENPGYRLDVGRKVFDERHKEYFKQLKEKHEIDLDVGQKMWYVQKHAINGDNMLAEYPSLPEEAFHSSIKGAYYASEMVRVYEDNRIMNIAVDPTIPVDTWWDLGMNDKNTIVFTQRYGNEIRVVDYYENSGEGLGHYVNKLKDKKYHYGVHTFPHDVKVRELSTGISRQQTLMDLRLFPIRIIERTKNVVDDIEGVRRLFPRFYFDESRTGKLIEGLENYRREWNDKTGEFNNTPRHDKHSHPADAMRTLAKGWQNQGLTATGKEEELVTSDLF